MDVVDVRLDNVDESFTCLDLSIKSCEHLICQLHERISALEHLKSVHPGSPVHQFSPFSDLASGDEIGGNECTSAPGDVQFSTGIEVQAAPASTPGPGSMAGLIASGEGHSRAQSDASTGCNVEEVVEAHRSISAEDHERGDLEPADQHVMSSNTTTGHAPAEEEEAPCITLEGVDSATLEVCLLFCMHLSKQRAAVAAKPNPVQSSNLSQHQADDDADDSLCSGSEDACTIPRQEQELPPHDLNHGQLLDLLLLADYLQVEPLLHAAASSLVASMFPHHTSQNRTAANVKEAPAANVAQAAARAGCGYVDIFGVSQNEGGGGAGEEEAASLSAEDIHVLRELPNTIALVLASKFPPVDGWEALRIGMEEGWWGWPMLLPYAAWVASLLTWAGEREDAAQQRNQNHRAGAQAKGSKKEWWKEALRREEDDSSVPGDTWRFIDPWVPALIQRALGGGEGGVVFLRAAVEAGVGPRALFAVSVMWTQAFCNDTPAESRAGREDGVRPSDEHSTENSGGGAKVAPDFAGGQQKSTNARAGLTAGWREEVLGRGWAEEYRKRLAAELERENEGVISLSESCLPPALEDVTYLGREHCQQLPAHLPLLLALLRFIHNRPSLRHTVAELLLTPPTAHWPFPSRTFGALPSVVTWVTAPGLLRCGGAVSTEEHADKNSELLETAGMSDVSELPRDMLVAAFWVFGCTAAMPLVAEGVCRSKEMPSLTALDFEGCSTLLPATVARACLRFRALRRIDLKGAVLVGDEVLRCVARTCSQLEMLQIGGCTRITDEGVVRFLGSLEKVPRPDLDGQHAAALVKLSLMNCSQLTNSTLSAVADGLSGLRDLCVYGCYRMTDDALIRFKRSHRLSKLNTSGCYKITDMGIRYLMQVKPTLLLYHKHSDFYLPLTSRDLR